MFTFLILEMNINNFIIYFFILQVFLLKNTYFNLKENYIFRGKIRNIYIYIIILINLIIIIILKFLAFKNLLSIKEKKKNYAKFFTRMEKCCIFSEKYIKSTMCCRVY